MKFVTEEELKEAEASTEEKLQIVTTALAKEIQEFSAAVTKDIMDLGKRLKNLEKRSTLTKSEAKKNAKR